MYLADLSVHRSKEMLAVSVYLPHHTASLHWQLLPMLHCEQFFRLHTLDIFKSQVIQQIIIATSTDRSTGASTTFNCLMFSVCIVV
jgi:hypothetical protein